jgi:hypothetical protein
VKNHPFSTIAVLTLKGSTTRTRTGRTERISQQIHQGGWAGSANGVPVSTADAQDPEAFASPALQAKKETWTWTARRHGQPCAMDIGNRADSATPPSHGARPSRHEAQILKLSSSRWPHIRHWAGPLVNPVWDTREGVALGGPGAWECGRLSPRHTSRRQASRNRLMSPRAGHRPDQAWVSAGTSGFQFWQRATRRNGRGAAAGPLHVSQCQTTAYQATHCQTSPMRLTLVLVPGPE